MFALCSWWGNVIRNIDAIGSGILGDSEYLHETSALNTTSQCIYNASRPKLDVDI